MKATFKLQQKPPSRRRDILQAFLHDEDGATAIEYGLIASLVIIGIIAALKMFSANTSSMYTNIATTLTGG